MRLFGTLREIIDLIFRNSSGNLVTINPDTAGTGDDVTLDLPPVAGPASDVLVGAAATQTLTGKTIDADNNTISNLAHGSEVDNPSSGVHGVTGNVVGTSDTQTLTNKALTSPTLNGGVALTATSTELNQLDDVEVGGTASGDIVDTDSAQDLSNKDIYVTTCTFSDHANGKSASISIASMTGANATYTMPVATDTLVGRASVDTLTNKTLTSPRVNNPEINEAVACTATSTTLNQLTGVTIGGNAAGDILTTDDTQTITGKTIDGNNNTISNLAHGSEVDDPSSGVHGVTGSVVGTSDSQALTNKQLEHSSVTFDDIIDSKVFQIDLSGSDASTTTTLLTNSTANRNINLPNATDTLVGRSTIDTLTNKTLTAPDINNPDIDCGTASNTQRILLPKNTTANLDGLTDVEASVAYDTDLSNIVFNDGTKWVEVGSGSGSGVNYIADSDAESGTGSWATYADAAGTTPVDGDGAGANITWAQNTTTPLRGTADFKLVKDGADRQGEGVAYDFTIDRADTNKTLWISFDVDATDAAYTAGDLAVYIIKDTGGTPTLVTPAYTSIAAATYQFKTSFNADSNTDYRLCIHVAGTTATAWTGIHFDNFKVGPEELIQTTPISDWTSYDPTFVGLGTVTNKNIEYKQVGDTLEIRGSFTTGTVAASVPTMTLPSGLTVSNRSATDINIAGTCFMTGTASSTAATVLGVHGASLLNFGRLRFDGSGVAETDTSVLANAMFSSSRITTIKAEVKIAEWAGSSTGLSNSRVMFASNDGSGGTAANTAYDTGMVYGPSGSSIPSVDAGSTGNHKTKYRVRFLQSITDKFITLWLHDGNQWVPAENTQYSERNHAQLRYGIGVEGISGSDTDVYVTFGNRGANTTSATYNGSGDAWSTLSGWKWVAIASSNPLSIGMPQTIKWQQKFLAADIRNVDAQYFETTASNSDFKFTVTPGKTYRITAQFALIDSDTTNSLTVSITDDTATIARASSSFGSGSYSMGYIAGVSTIRTMVSDTIRAYYGVSAKSNSLIVSGNNTASETWMIVEELPYHTEYAGW